MSSGCEIKMIELKRTLGLFDAFAIGIGAIIGSGINQVFALSRDS